MIKIFVGNLPYLTSGTDLKSVFEQYGCVSAVNLVIEPCSGRSRGFAFVNMPRLDDADEAISRLNGSSLHGRRLVVNEARGDSLGVRRVDPPQQSRWHLI